MTGLLDTHVLLWAVFEPHRLSRRARAFIESPDSQLLLSPVSIWEIITKVSTGKLTLFMPVTGFIAAQQGLLRLTSLPLTMEHALALEGLPWHHKDPGDRLLLAQAMREQVPVVSSDERFARYPVQVLW